MSDGRLERDDGWRGGFEVVRRAWIETTTARKERDRRPALAVLPGGGRDEIDTTRHVWICEADERPHEADSTKDLAGIASDRIARYESWGVMAEAEAMRKRGERVAEVLQRFAQHGGARLTLMAEQFESGEPEWCLEVRRSGAVRVEDIAIGSSSTLLDSLQVL